MPIIAKDTRREFTPAPEGLQQAVCCDVIDLGLVKDQWGEREKIEIRWQLEEINPETNKHFIVPSRYTLSLHEKSNLRGHLESWRGRRFTADELRGFDLERLIGVNCQLQIVHVLSEDGRVFGNIQAIVPIGKGMVKLRVMDDYVRQKDRVERSGNGGKAEKEVEHESEDVAPF